MFAYAMQSFVVPTVIIPYFRKFLLYRNNLRLPRTAKIDHECETFFYTVTRASTNGIEMTTTVKIR